MLLRKNLELSKGYQLGCRDKQQQKRGLFPNPAWSTCDMPEKCIWKGNDTDFK